MAGHVFVSYSRTDAAFVQLLAKALHSAGVEVWYDENIELGDPFVPALREHIETCAAFILVMTPASEASRWVQNEVLLAQQKGCRVIPLLLSGEPHLAVLSINHIDASDGKIPAKLVSQLGRGVVAQAAALSTPAEVLGPRGRAALIKALEPLGVQVVPVLVDQAALTAFRTNLANRLWSPELDRARIVVEDLSFAIRTRVFLNDHMVECLQTVHLRDAVRDAMPTGLRQGLVTDGDHVEHVALAYPADHPDCRQTMTRFVAALAHIAGAAKAGPALRAWGIATGMTVQVNDLRQAAAARRRSRRLRLVVSVDSSLAGGWPGEVGIWLLRDNELCDRTDVDCDLDEAGAETALRVAVKWGHARKAEHDVDPDDPSRRLPLERVDIALPASLAVSWHPERVTLGSMMIMNYTVVLHWSRRLNPMPEWINIEAEKRLDQLEERVKTTGPAVHWLTASETANLAVLERRLQKGQLGAVVGLTARPTADPALVELLLSYAPILLWPEQGDQLPRGCRSAVVEHWPSLPEGFTTAYRERWSTRRPGPLARLRAVWDDHEWLEFCRSMQR